MLHRHATDVVALVSGTIFAGLAAVWLLIVSDTIDLERAWIGGPVILIIAGVLGLLVTLTPNRETIPAPILDQSHDPQYDLDDDVVDPTATGDEPTTILGDVDGEDTQEQPER